MPRGSITNVDERYSLQVSRTNPINPMGSTNTAVFVFDQAPVQKWGTVYSIASTGARPTEGSGQWVSVINDAVLGTSIKFWKRGIYEIHAAVNVPVETENPPLAVGALILDSSAASMLAGAAILPTTLNANGAPGVIDWCLVQQGAAAVTLKLGGSVDITDTLAGGPAPVAGTTGATGVGTVRLHLNNGAGGAFGAAALIASLWVNYLNDLAG